MSHFHREVRYALCCMKADAVLKFRMFQLQFRVQVTTDHAGLEISVNSRIALPFSRHVAIGNGGLLQRWSVWEQNHLFAAIS